MPYPNVHSARLRNPGDFKERPDWSGAGKFRTTRGGTIFGRIKVPRAIEIVWGQLKTQSGDQAAPQSLHFPIDRWTADKARKWLADRKVNYESFEPARAKDADLSAGYMPAPETIRLTAPLAIRGAADRKGPRRFSGVLYAGGPVKVHGYVLPVVIDLAGLGGLDRKRPLTRDHDDSKLVGHIERYENDGGTLQAEGFVSATGNDAQEVLAAHDNGFPWQVSVEVLPEGAGLEEVAGRAAIQVNCQTLSGPLLVARRSKFLGASVVAHGADDETTLRIAATKATSRESRVEKGKIMNDVGNPVPDELRPAWDREGLSDGERVELRLRRFHADYGDVLPGFGGGMVRAASAGQLGWPDAEREILRAEVRALTLKAVRAERPQGPGIRSSSRDMAAPAIEAALCRSVGLAVGEKHYKPEVLEAADHFRNLGLQETILLAAHANGYSGGRHHIDAGNLGELLRCAFASPIQAGFSGGSLTGILSNVANKVLLAGFDTIEKTWRMIARIRPVADLKTVTSYRLTADALYEEVGPTGEIAHGALGEDNYTNRAKTYAKMFSLSRADIINDDLGAFDDLRNRLGRGAALKLNDVFWGAFLNNSTFFTSARGNYQEGAGTALTDTGGGLVDAEKLFLALTDADGNPLGVEPALLLVPADLSATARRLYSSAEIRDTTANVKYAVANIWQNRYRPLVSQYLNKSKYTGYSATAHYLLADPANLATIEVCFLDGREAPTVESSDADFDTLGIQFRGYHDFGVALAEWRAGVKSKGAA